MNIFVVRFWTKSFASWTTSPRPTPLVGRTRWRTSCSTWAQWRWSTSRRTSSLLYLRLHISEATFSSSRRRSPRPPSASRQGSGLTPRCPAEPAPWALHARSRPCPTILVRTNIVSLYYISLNFQISSWEWLRGNEHLREGGGAAVQHGSQEEDQKDQGRDEEI